MANLQTISAAATLLLLLLLNFKARSADSLTMPPVPDVSSLLAQCKNIGSKFPPPNSFVCYRTTTKQDGRLQTCEAGKIQEGSISVVKSSENYTVMVVHTPGRLLNRTYVDRLLCRWDIRCPDNQLMYWDMAEHFIEPQRSSPLFQKEVCVDYLKLYRDSGVESSCGFVDNYTDLEPNNLRIEFRSNNNFRFPGFKLRVVCFSPDLQDIPGCSPQQKRLRQARNTKSAKSSMQQGLEPFSHLQPRVLRSRRTRQTMAQVQQMVVNQDSSIHYASGNIQIITSGFLTFSVKGIFSFHTYTSLDGLVSYYSDRGQQIELRGEGLLTISRSGGVAYYYRYGVDNKFVPSLSQRDAISRMLDAEDVLVVKNDFIIEEKQATTKSTLDSSMDNPIAVIPQQSAAQSRGIFSPDVITTAEAGVNSCNSVVRAVSQSVLDLAESN